MAPTGPAQCSTQSRDGQATRKTPQPLTKLRPFRPHAGNAPSRRGKTTSQPAKRRPSNDPANRAGCALGRLRNFRRRCSTSRNTRRHSTKHSNCRCAATAIPTGHCTAPSSGPARRSGKRPSAPGYRAAKSRAASTVWKCFSASSTAIGFRPDISRTRFHIRRVRRGVSTWVTTSRPPNVAGSPGICPTISTAARQSSRPKFWSGSGAS